MGKQKGKVYFRSLSVLVMITFVLWITFPQYLFALPSNPTVESGEVTFENPNETTLIINASDQAIINFDSFSIAQNELVQFIQPNEMSSVLSRVLGSSSSDIFGSLFANGQLILVNPNGIHFGANANIEVGSLIASTLNIQSQLFLDNQFTFEQLETQNIASILNEADIAVRNGGHLVFLSETIENRGTMTANMGTVALGVGEQITVSLDAGGMINLVVNQGLSHEIQNARPVIANTGEIRADGGKVELTARTLTDVFDTLINNQGVIQAERAVMVNGEIQFVSPGEEIPEEAAIEIPESGKVEIESNVGIVNQGVIRAHTFQEEGAAFLNDQGGALDLDYGYYDNLDGAMIIAQGSAIGGINNDTGNIIVQGPAPVTLLNNTTLNADSDGNGTGIFLMDSGAVIDGTLANRFNLTISSADTPVVAPGPDPLPPGSTPQIYGLANIGILNLNRSAVAETPVFTMNQNIGGLGSLLIGAGVTYSLNGNNFGFLAAAAVSNNGIFRLQGGETLTNVTNLDIDSGTVQYVGNGNGVQDNITIKVFGATDYFNLTINDTNPTTDIFSLASSLDVDNNLLVSGGTFTSGTQIVDIDGSVIISGGTFNATSTTMAVGDDFTFSGGTFNHNSGTVVFDTANQADFSGGQSIVFNNFTSTVAGKILQFSATGNPTYEIAGAWTLTGASGNLLRIVSGNGSNQVRINPSGTRALNFVWIQAINNVGTALTGAELTNSTQQTFSSTNFGTTAATWNEAVSGNWSDATNWNGIGGVAPGLGDNVIFDGTGVGNATIDAGFAGDIQNLTLSAGYTGTLTLARNLTLNRNGVTGAGTLNIGNGSFDGGTNNTLTIQGSYVQSGGVFTAPGGASGLMRVQNNWTHTAGGTFNHNSGSVQFFGADGLADGQTINVNGSETFNNFEFDSGNSVTRNLEVNDILNVLGDLRLTDGFYDNVSSATSTAEIRVFGDLITSASFGGASFNDGGSGRVAIVGNSRTIGANIAVDGAGGAYLPGLELRPDAGQDIVVNLPGSAANPCPVASCSVGFGNGLMINGNSAGDIFNSSDTISLGRAALGDFTLVNGVFNAPELNFNISDSFTHTSGTGTFNHSNGTVVFTSTGGGVSGSINISAGDQFYNLTINKTGASGARVMSTDDAVIISNNFTMSDGFASTTGSGVFNVAGNVTIGTDFDGGTGAVSMVGTGTQSYAHNGGVEPSGTFTINKSAGTVTPTTNMEFNSAAGQDFTISAGTLDLNGFNLAVADVFTVNGSGIFNLDTETVNITNSFVLGGSGTVQANGGTFNITNNNFSQTGGTWDGDTGSTTINITTGSFVMSGGTFQQGSGNFSGANDIDISGGSYTQAGGYIDFNDDFLLSGTGSFTGGAGYIDIAGDYNQTAGTFIGGTGAGGAGQGYIDITGSFSATGGSFTLPTYVLATNSGYLAVATNFTLGAGLTFTHNNGLVGFDGISNQSVTTNGKTLYSVAVANTNGAGADNVAINDDLDMNGNFYILDGTFNMNSNPDVTIGGDFYWTSAGDIASGGTLTMDGSGTSMLSLDDQSFLNLTIASNKTVVATDRTGIFGTNASGDFQGSVATINSNAVLDLNGNNLQSLTTLVNDGTFQLEGGETVSIGSFDTNSGLTNYDGTGNYVAGFTQLAAGNNYYNLSFTGANGQWTAAGASLDINGNFNFSAGGGVFNAPTTMNLAGNFAATAGVYNRNSVTVTFDGTGLQTVTGGATAAGGFFPSGANFFENLIINGNGNTVRPQGAAFTSLSFRVNNDFTILNGTFDPETNSIDTEVAGMTTIGDNGLGGTAIFNAGSGAIRFGEPGSPGGVTIRTGADFNGGSGRILVIGNDFNQTGGDFRSSSDVMGIRESFIRSGGIFDHNNGEVAFINILGGAETITLDAATTFFNLTIDDANPATRTLAGSNPLNVAGDFIKGVATGTGASVSNATGTFDAADRTVNVTGSTEIRSGIYTWTTGAQNFNGGLTILRDVNATGVTNGIVTAGTGTMTVNGDLIVQDAGTLTGNGTTGIIDVNGNFTHSSSALLTLPAATMTVTGDVTISNGTMAHNSGTFTFDGAGNQNWTAGATRTFNNVNINGGGTTIAQNAIDMDGDFTITGAGSTYNANGQTTTSDGETQVISGGTYQAGTATQTFGDGTAGDGLTVGGAAGANAGTFIGGSGNIDVNGDVFIGIGPTAFTAPSAGASFTVSGNWDKRFASGTFTHNNGTVTFDGGGTQTIRSGAAAFYNMIHTGTSAVQVIIDDLTIANDFTNNDPGAGVAGNFDANGRAVTVNGLATVREGTYLASTATQTFGDGGVADGLTVNGGTFTGSTGNVDINGIFNLSAGTVTAPAAAATFTVSDDFLVSGGTFTANGGEVTLDTPATTATVDAPAGGLSFFDFTIVAGKTVLFTAGDTFNITSPTTWDVQGTAGNLITLGSTTPGTQWVVNPAGWTVDFVNVSDSNNISPVGIIDPTNSIDGGNTTRWFPSSPVDPEPGPGPEFRPNCADDGSCPEPEAPVIYEEKRVTEEEYSTTVFVCEGKVDVNGEMVNPGERAIAGQDGVAHLITNAIYVGTVEGIRVLRSNYHDVVKKFATPERPSALAVSDKNAAVYALLPETQKVYTVGANTITHQMRNDIFGLGEGASDMAVNSTGEVGYIANSGSDNIQVVNLQTKQTLNTFPTGSKPIQLTLSQDGGHLFVVNQLDKSVSKINANTGEQEMTFDAGTNPYGVALSADNKEIFVTDVEENKVHIYDATTFIKVGDINVGENPHGIEIDKEGKTLFVSNRGSNSLSIISIPERAEVANVPVGEKPVGIAVSPAGNELYVANMVSGDLSLVDVKAQKVTKNIPVGVGPTQVAFSAPDTSCVEMLKIKDRARR